LPTDSIPWRVARVDVSEEDTAEAKAITQLRARAYRSGRTMPAFEESEEEPEDFTASLPVVVTAKISLRRLSLPIAPGAFFRESDRAVR